MSDNDEIQVDSKAIERLKRSIIIKEKIYVRTEEGKDVMVEPAAWSNMRYHFNEVEKKIEEEVQCYLNQ